MRLEVSPGLLSKLIVILIPTSINFHLEINNPEETSKLETEFAEEVKKRGEDFKYFKDQVLDHFLENAIILSFEKI